MPIESVFTVISSYIDSTGWTNTNSITYLNSDDTSFISDGRPGETLKLKANSLSFSTNSLSSLYVFVGARTVGTVNRQKIIEVVWISSGGVREGDFLQTTGQITSTFPTSLFNVDGIISFVSNKTSDIFNTSEIWLEITEGAGMPDTATIDIDWVVPRVDYWFEAPVITKTSDDPLNTFDENYFFRLAIRQTGDDIVLINDGGVQLETIRNVTMTQNLTSITDEKFSQMLALRNMLDDVSVYDEYSFIWDQSTIIYTKTGESLINVTDQIISGRVLNRTVLDAHTITDQNLAATFRNLLATDTVALADTILSAASRVRASDDSAAINDEIRSFSERNKSALSQFDVQDQSLSSLFRNSSSQDSIEAQDFISISANRNRQATSDALLSDESLATLTNARLLSDSVSLLDESLYSRAFGKLSSEVLDLQDALIRYAIRNRTADDALTLIDSFLFEVIQSGQFYFKTTDDSFSLFDENLREVFSVRLEDDEITLIDAASVSASRFNSAEDIILILDAIASTAERNREATSTVNVQDVFSFDAIRNKLSSDLIDVTDENLAIRLIQRAFEDAIENVIDQFNFSIVGVVLSELIDDSVTIKDETSFFISANRSATDNVLAIDQILSHAKYERLSQDLAAITDNLDKRLDFYRATDEQIEVLDSVVWIINRIKILSDEFTISDDQLSFRIRGRDALEALSIYDENIYKIIGDLRFGVRIRIGVAGDVARLSVDVVAILTSLSEVADLDIENLAMIGINNPAITLGAYH